MTALPVTPNVIRFTFRQSLPGNSNIMNRLFYQYAGTPPTVPMMQTLCQSTHTTFTSNMGTHLPQNWFLEETKAVDLSHTTNPEVSYSVPTAGTLVGNPMPPSECALINYQVDRRYRGGHPRFYQSGLVTENVQADGTLLQPWAGQFKNAHDLMLNEIGSAAWTGRTAWHHCNVSYYSGYTNIIVTGKRAKVESTPRATPTVDTIVGTVLFPTVASQRRRIVI